jgi:hypothetical protein
MLPSRKKVYTRNEGSVLIISMMVVVVFSALAISIASISGNNVQLADNQHKADRARACAESGFDVIRYWMNRVAISGTTTESQRFNKIAESLQYELSSEYIANITTACDGSVITIPNVTLSTAANESFSASITMLDNDTLQIDVTGIYGSMQKTIRGEYLLGEQGNTVFDFGVATKGPLSMTGNTSMSGVNIAVESSVYIESENSNLALSMIGNSQIAGDVSIANPLANALLQGQAGIGGDTGQTAIDNHVHFNAGTTNFPTMNTAQFDQYVTSEINSGTNMSAKATYQNVRIAANTNPKFTKQITLNGVVVIETPNVVEFAGGVNITGIIVGKGSDDDDSAVNKLKFTGNVISHSITSLPNEAQFNGIRQQTGTFILAPGFSVSFGGNFQTISGAIASNGVEFYGNAGGTINGSIINYSENEMTVSGNSDLYFNRSGTSQSPAGFVPEIILRYDPSSYLEVML